MAAQSGYVYKRKNKRDGAWWWLRYRDDVLNPDTRKLERRHLAVKLAPVSGTYRRKSDLSALVAEKLTAVRQSAACPNSAETLTHYVEEVWLPWLARTKKPSTGAGYRSYFARYIKPRVGDVALRDFTVATVSKLLADVARSHSVNVATVGKIRSVLQSLFTFAISRGDYAARSMAENPARGALLPDTTVPKQETVAASREDVKAMLALLDKKGLLLERAAIAISAFCGTRPSETRGLKWQDWDRLNDHIGVNCAVVRAWEGTTKTEKSVRSVAVTSELRAILLDLWRARKCPISGYILSREDGRRVNLDNLSKRTLIPAFTKAKIPWDGWYSLRRFHGTEVRKLSSSDTMSKALGNSRVVADAHYLKHSDVLPDVRQAVNDAFRGLSVPREAVN